MPAAKSGAVKKMPAAKSGAVKKMPAAKSGAVKKVAAAKSGAVKKGAAAKSGAVKKVAADKSEVVKKVPAAKSRTQKATPTACQHDRTSSVILAFIEREKEALDAWGAARKSDLQAQIAAFDAFLEKNGIKSEKDLMQKQKMNKLPGVGKIERAYMTEAMYRKKLVAHGVRMEGQDVFHIIAAENGGPNHPDNYLFSLGSGFNRSIGHRWDELNCFLAGLEKTRAAWAIAHETAKSPKLVAEHIRSKKPVTSGVHKGRSPEELYNMGKKLFNDFMRDARNKK